MAVMAQSAQKGVDHGAVAQEVVPFVIVEIAGHNRGPAVIALFHEFEKDVGLFRLEVEVPEFIDQKDIQSGQPFQELACGAVGERSIHIIKQVLSTNELTTVTI